jgi:hypothetical protein
VFEVVLTQHVSRGLRLTTLITMNSFVCDWRHLGGNFPLLSHLVSVKQRRQSLYHPHRHHIEAIIVGVGFVLLLL